MIKAVAAGMVFIFLAMYIMKIFNVSRLLLLLFCILNVGLLAITKSAVYLTLKRYRGSGFNYRNMLIIGSRERAKELIRNVQSREHSGYRVTGRHE